jgi:hypothetical protein
MHSKMLLILAGMTVIGGATSWAQDYPSTIAPSPGIPSAQAVNPAPDAPGPYMKDGADDFYHPMVRERALTARVQAALQAGRLTPAQARLAEHDLTRVAAESRMQIMRHGDLRDWDRERLNDMMNHLVERFPSLQG